MQDWNQTLVLPAFFVTGDTFEWPGRRPRRLRV